MTRDFLRLWTNQQKKADPTEVESAAFPVPTLTPPTGTPQPEPYVDHGGGNQQNQEQPSIPCGACCTAGRYGLDRFLMGRYGVATLYLGMDFGVHLPLRAQLGVLRLGTDDGAHPARAVGLPLHREAVETEAQRLPHGVVILQLLPLPLRQVDGLECFALAVARRQENQEKQEDHGL